MDAYKYLIKTHDSSKIGFKMIYCQEAHAEDEWRIGSKYKVYQHKTLDNRKEAAKYLIDEFNLEDIGHEMFIDTIENKFQKLYSSWPTRFYLIQNSKIKYICYPQKADFAFAYVEVIQKIDELLK
jgi:hypothetical protein